MLRKVGVFWARLALGSLPQSSSKWRQIVSLYTSFLFFIPHVVSLVRAPYPEPTEVHDGMPQSVPAGRRCDLMLESAKLTSNSLQLPVTSEGRKARMRWP